MWTPRGILSAPYVHTLVFTTAKIEMMRDNNDYFNLSGSGPVMGVVCYTQGNGLESGNYFVALRSPNKPKDIGLDSLLKNGKPFNAERTIGKLQEQFCKQ